MTETEIRERTSASFQGFQRSKFMRILGTGSAVLELAIIVVLLLFTLFVSIGRQPGESVSTTIYSLLNLLKDTSMLSFVALFILDLDGGVDHATMALAGIGLLVQRFCFFYHFSIVPTVWMKVWWIAVGLETVAMTKIAVLYFRQGL